MRPWHFAALSAALALGASAHAADVKPTGSPSAAGYVPMGKDEQGVWAEAEENERALKDSKLVIRDPGVNAYLRHVLCREVGEASCASVRIYLLRVPAFNASMSPNGTLVVYSGLLLRVRDEAELATVLGHEFTHFEDRHSLSDLKKRRSAMSWAAWLTAATATGVRTSYFPIFAAGYFAYSRDQEREADRGSLQLLSRAGYAPMSASAVWLHMREEQDAQAAALGVKSLKDRDYGPFASHPMDIERMTMLAREGQALVKGEGFEGLAEFRAAMAPIWPMLIDDQIKLNDFGGSEYVLANLARGDWTGPLLFARAELYRARAKGGDLLTAETLYRQAIVKPDAPDAAWRGLGLVLLRIGQRDEGRAMIGDYLKRQPDIADRAVLQSIANGD